MRLEDEIYQKEFRNEYQKLTVNLIFTHNWLMSKLKPLLLQHGLTPQQFNILRILRGQYPNPASINLLKERMLDRMSDASRIVERLRLKGMVERKECPSDRRQVEVRITAKGLEVLKKIDAMDDQIDAILSNLNQEEARTLNSLLDKLRG